ncbi:putative N-acetyltransferase YhbS [Motilibacter peucedani]|uniref:Putative N-acetyltransferase YhbS n=1 Tax=Motilibacter peucedani TaxID=598650 RepID=A0A420XKZ7_9ACTN|nr:GNAT family N-acetyltransferase [Motilibacter peucedani]RKS69331.1 putative N-acetyltransferase YhbS [Motilibacter peucedani]
MSVRAGTPADLAALVPLAGSHDRAVVRLRAAAEAREVLLVAEVDGAVVGAVSVRWRSDCDAPHPWLYGLHVLPEHRRRGVAQALVLAAEDAARSAGAEALSLDADRDDIAVLGFYERRGYARVREHDHRWQSVDPVTGAVVASGTSPTWILRRRLHGDAPLSAAGPSAAS